MAAPKKPSNAKLSDIEQYFLDQNYNDLSLPTLAEKLNRSVKFVEKLVNEKKAQQPIRQELPQVRSPAPAQEGPPPDKAFSRLVGRQRNSDGTVKKNGPIVMTEAAAMVADDHLKYSNPGLPPRLAKNVFRMNPEE